MFLKFSSQFLNSRGAVSSLYYVVEEVENSALDYKVLRRFVKNRLFCMRVSNFCLYLGGKVEIKTIIVEGKYGETDCQTVTMFYGSGSDIFYINTDESGNCICGHNRSFNIVYI